MGIYSYIISYDVLFPIDDRANKTSSFSKCSFVICIGTSVVLKPNHIWCSLAKMSPPTVPCSVLRLNQGQVQSVTHLKGATIPWTVSAA